MKITLPVLTLLGCLAASATAAARVDGPSHPRLYCTSEDLPRLRELRGQGRHAVIWRNVQESAEWCLSLLPRKAWIAPVSPDPRHENLYDRFYAIMGDLAVTEHLAFAYALSGDERYGNAARQWVLASCRAWQREADGEPDGSKAYAVARLLKGVAVGYDLAFDRFSAAERQEIRQTLVRIGEKYHTRYFSTPAVAGPGFHTHHAIVEWSSLGVAALALLGEAPEAENWLAATVRKFEDHLLPTGLAPDGAQTEGATFWASTMHYRILFMDALRRVTGRDLFGKHAQHMNAELALAAIAAERFPGYDQHHANVVLEPSYGQLDYYAPVLVFLAREYRRPIYQYLAHWDHSLGSIQRTRYITPNGEKLLFAFGGYAYVWYDPTLPAKPSGERLSYRFPSVDEAYLRASWRPNDLLVGVRNGEIVVHAGGRPILIEPVDWRPPPTGLGVHSLEDDGSVATIRCGDAHKGSLTIELHRPDRRLVIRRRAAGDWQWWCQGVPTHADNTLSWEDEIRLKVTAGEISHWQPTGYSPRLSVGNGALTLADPVPQRFPQVTITPPENGEAIVEVKWQGGAQ